MTRRNNKWRCVDAASGVKRVNRDEVKKVDRCGVTAVPDVVPPSDVLPK